MKKQCVASLAVPCLFLCAFVVACDSNQPTSDVVAAPAAVGSGPKSVPGPVPGTRMTEDYVRQVGRSAYLWAWPMVNVHNRLVAFSQLPEPGLIGGIVPAAPPNQLSMLTDYIVPEERVVACPNQDVVYGFS